MSARSSSAVWRHSKSSGSARLVLLALADEANDEGAVVAYKRSHSALAAKAVLSEASVARSIRKLVDLGELEVLARGDGRKSSEYQIVLPGLGVEGSQIDHPQPPARDDRGASNRASRVVKSRTQGSQDDPPIIPLFPVLPQNTSPALEAPACVLDAEFTAWWTAYPRHESRRKARQAWERSRAAVGAQTLLDGAQRFAAHHAALGTEQRFIPHPTTWLNGGRWDDDLTAMPTGPGTDGYYDPPVREYS